RQIPWKVVALPIVAVIAIAACWGAWKLLHRTIAPWNFPDQRGCGPAQTTAARFRPENPTRSYRLFIDL
ncbi:hypothetical protein, partial [Comamonas aquatica]|uniref:hypothetical protein n=1 Tax=Comamonas aquatica TaxID=225991 RepID=UPI003D017D11